MFLQTIVYVFYAVVIMSTSITFHEMGHFIAAKLLKLDVLSVTLGYPPTFLKFKLFGTPINVGILMFGGVVFVPITKGNTKKMILTTLAGPFVSYLVAFLFFVIATKDASVGAYFRSVYEISVHTVNMLLPNSGGSMDFVVGLLGYPNVFEPGFFSRMMYLFNVLFATSAILPIPGADGGSALMRFFDLLTKDKYIYLTNAINNVSLVLFFVYCCFLAAFYWVVFL